MRPLWHGPCFVSMYRRGSQGVVMWGRVVATLTSRENIMAGMRVRAGRAAAMLWLISSVLVFLFAPPIATRDWGWRPTHIWILNIIAGAVTLVAIGQITGQHLLTDERRRWSLSRLQLLCWMLLLLPSVWTMVVLKLAAGVADPLALGMDENLWALLGITAASFVGAPLILERKRATPGLIDARPIIAKPDQTGELRDLFRGEEAGNAELVDLGRVQMCLFTAVALLVYFAACWTAFAREGAAALAFPAVSQSLVALLGISHATYLAGKLPDRPAPPTSA